jgi:hypothetical protein
MEGILVRGHRVSYTESSVMTTEYTKNFALALPDFRTGPWHDYINNDFKTIDGLIYGAISQADIHPWAHSTNYVVGIAVLDTVNGTTWMCATAHTSADHGTFAADRLDNPTYWTQLINGFSPRGEWTHSTSYFPYDLTYSTPSAVFALCKTSHVSNAAGTILDDGANWSIILDFGGMGPADAVAVAYDNMNSQLVSGNVQAAIDEVDHRVDLAETNIQNNATQITIVDNKITDPAKGLQAQINNLKTYNTDVQDPKIKDNYDYNHDVQDKRMQTIEDDVKNKVTGNYTAVNKAGDVMTGHLIASGQVGAVGPGPVKSILFHCDDVYGYIIPADKNGANFSSHRPFYVHFSDGDVTLAGAGENVITGGPLTVGGILKTTGQISSDIGYAAKAGTSGALLGHVFNFFWTGTVLQGYVDDTPANVATCDPRIKKNIRVLNIDALSYVDRLIPVSFRYKDISIYKDDGKRHVGFLADNVHEVLPEAVIGEIDATTTKGEILPAGLDQLAIIATLVRAVQQLKIRVERLENPV